ncbi:MAG: D-2-hydroxyacid dehydrogenase [Candidatus Bathyarchaeia archaeon]
MHVVRVVVSGIPRGYQMPREDGNWLQEKHRRQIMSVSSGIELVEIPQGEVHKVGGMVEGAEVFLAEGGNTVHYGEELDREDYLKFFTPSLRWVQLCSTGFSDNLTPEIIGGQVVLTNAPGIHTIPIAESVLAAMLDHAKRLKQRRIDQGDHVWGNVKLSELYGSTVLLLGLGNIGRRIARLCKSFEMRVIGTKRRVEEVENVDLVFPSDELKLFLGEADYVVIAAPLTPLTENMIGPEEFEAMKDSAYLINVGRGRIVDEAAMIEALMAKSIGGAYLDCHVEEPLPSDHPLWDMENVLVIPHDSHSSPFIGDRIVDIFCENLCRYMKEEPLLHVCDPARGY